MFKPLIPFEPISRDTLPTGPQWIAQVKWDGVRMLAYEDGHELRLVNRRLHDRTAQYPELVTPRNLCSGSSYILDGEVIALDPDTGKPSFYHVLRRDRMSRPEGIAQAIHQIPVTYMVFDILFYEGKWVTDQPLADRQRLLHEVLNTAPHVQEVTNTLDAASLLTVMRQHQMEGIVCKDLTSSYGIQGKDQRWQKVKIMHDVYAMIGGVTYRSGIVNAVAVGVYDGPDFVYIGHVGTGKLNSNTWRELTHQVEPLIRQDRPFNNVPERSAETTWVEPRIGVKVQYMELTHHNTLRHPSIQTFAEVTREDCLANQLLQ
ncbi:MULTISPECIES: RNA ligase family protein [Paenibacillus]|uniref:ATP-dependent DNA ligase n=1 Tax=Paenibacillus TaxID=44249 RepID=UPI000F5259C1|nr:MULTISPECIES: RNA ligase family protein [Paenibacillus]KAA8747258.1 DNA ligase [Paenibacillus sp. UASWS1643]RPK24105.1 ATP-dependent DNA ligase clustered with Ku protein, LigD [Paenibacillus xylanexedens]